MDLFPLRQHVQFNTYYEHENNTGKHPNQPKTAVGMALLSLFLAV
ncbi:hypothetical protein EDE15_0122 [Edaphobacter aggregans]|jgi:hypothetical protein|uniref:Uncharacterized protein n=1 Tax=Edaphobacter aggregans TaxID=570835 RepID=A0A3R9NU60_9BACT|nr:hypothetical protein EDE15_0122 [Edaphobacter aggregans]